MLAYILAIIAIIITILEFGIIGPELISHRSWEGVAMGILSLVVYFPLMFYLGKATLKSAKHKGETK
jgi:uncharacterized membrane protein